MNGINKVLTAAAVLFTACSSGLTSRLSDDSFDPRPERDAPNDLIQQAKRYRGQKSFANIDYSIFKVRSLATEGVASEPRPSGQREIEESDVFRIGAHGSKLIYLLNNYRGLQIVSFAEGAEAPKILGRVAPTGGFSENMYYLERAGRIIALEDKNTDDNGQYIYSTNQSRLVIYDVSDPLNPGLEKTVELQGEIADSRVVGNVLYIATSVRPRWNEKTSDTDGAKGLVYSIQFGAQGVVFDSLKKMTLSLPTSARENMNIVEVKDGDHYKYYLLAFLSESGWGWWDARSLVEVVDISDPQGEIKSVMVVSAKGNVRERSQAFIKDNRLVVVSNYPYQASLNQTINRIAVETFELPGEGAKVISEDESLFRKLRIERELSRVSPEDKEEVREKLIADQDFGLKNVFVKLANEKLRKLFADSSITVGDTTGLSASLQDVRVHDQLLYVFWVPSNNVDPLDLFDIGDLEQGPKYLKRLYFDGWISRAEPITYKNRQFVLGLGHIIEAENNEQARRQPQAMLFEIVNRNGSEQAVELAQFTLSNESGWTDFNRGDKYVDFRLDANGQATIMFQVTTRIDDQWRSGGKLIGVNLDAACNGVNDKIFSEGGFMATENASWLKRVFRNREIEKINTFSDTELATFEDGFRSVMAGQVMNSISVLELARNVVGYVPLSGVSAGIQVISKGSRYSYYGGQQAVTELRLVDRQNVDGEESERLDKLSLAGAYSSKINIGENEFIIATDIERRILANVDPQEDSYPRYNYFTEVYLYRIRVEGTQFKLISESKWDTSSDTSEGLIYSVPYHSGEVEFIDAYGGLAFFHNRLYAVDKNQPSLLRKFDFEACEFDDNLSLNIKMMGQKLYFHGRESLEFRPEPRYEASLNFTKHYLSELNIDLENNLVRCGAMINIPGSPVALYGESLITSDRRLLSYDRLENESMIDGVVETHVSYRPYFEPMLTSTRIERSETAGLVDLLSVDDSFESDFKILKGGTIAYLKSSSASNYSYPHYGESGYVPSNIWISPTEYKSSLVFLNVDEDGFFTSLHRAIDFGIHGKVYLARVVQKGTGDILLAAVGRRVFVIDVDVEANVSLRSITSSTKNGRVDPQGTSIMLPRYLSPWSTSVDYDKQLNRLLISQGLYGLTSIEM